ncbi:amidohydrolase family protein [Corynebacterium hindlerae]|uniref:amidohydrolase family protein n=1 Tax=Corynebacterium hindlerae TaxID=699041 RepID=UPI003AABEEEA
MSHSVAAIDTHAHVYPAWYLDRLVAAGGDPAATAVARGIRADSTPEDIQARIAGMDIAGVEVQLLAVTPQSPIVPDAAAGEKLARDINEEYLRLHTEYPGRFWLYAALPLPHVAASLREIERIATEPFLGVSFPALLPGGGSLNNPDFDPIWEALNDAHAVVNIHPTGQGACSAPMLEHRLEWVNGAPVEDAIATLHLLKADIPARYPNIHFHVAHLGGDLPFLAQRIEDNYTDWNAFPSSPRQTLSKFYFDAANFHEPSLRLAAETFGPTQIMAGSDFPYFQDSKYTRAFSYVRDSSLSEEHREAVLRGNAMRLFGK